MDIWTLSLALSVVINIVLLFRFFQFRRLSASATNVLAQRASTDAAMDKCKTERNNLRLQLWAEVEKAKDLERKKVNQELHDGLGADLTEAQYTISLMRRGSLTPAEHRVLDNLSTSISVLSHKIRSISSGNSAERIDEVGLTESIRQFARKKDGVRGTSIHFEALGTARDLGYPRALAVYRLVQEIIANSLKHAKCQNLWVRLFWEEGRMVLEAEDDGQADGSKVASKSIRRRVDELSV